MLTVILAYATCDCNLSAWRILYLYMVLAFTVFLLGLVSILMVLYCVILIFLGLLCILCKHIDTV